MLPHFLTFNYLKRTVSIEAVLNVRGLGTSLKKRRDQLVGPCPVHGGDNPHAFVVNLSNNIWHCFTKCNGGGDVVELVRRMDNKTYHETAQYLASLTHSLPPTSAPQKQAYSKTPFKPFTRRLYLNTTTPWLRNKGISAKTVAYFEAGHYQGSGFLSDCIGVRLHDLKGSPIGYAGRRLVPGQIKNYGKWKLPPRLPKNDILYNFHRVRSNLHKGLFLVESPWSVMRLAQLNIPSVALLGIHLSHRQHQILCAISKIILMLDGDNPGKVATKRIRKTFQYSTQVQQVNLDEDTDPDDLNDHDLYRLAKPFFL